MSVTDLRVASAGAGSSPYRLIDPSVLARISNLELVARTVVEGFINGLHRSPHLGASMDFAEHRSYMPGDDIRRIDWRLYARTDRYFVKEFEADTNTNFVVLVDVSRSMRYAGPSAGVRVTKLEYAAFLTAALAYFSAHQRDRVGLVTFDDGVIDYVPPSARHLQNVLHALDRAVRASREESGAASSNRDRRKGNGNGNGHGARAAEQTDAPPARTPLREITRQLAESFRRRSLVAVVSDFYEDPDDIVDAMSYLRGKGNDLIAFHLLDHAELEFPFTDAASFADLETGARMPIVPEYLRKQYQELIRQHSSTLASRLGEGRIDYSLFDTSKPLDEALFAYLSLRERLARVR
jgi:uncharacterized protein (DUF58 family)